ncbi:MAG: iron-sulfur cluster assembly scaffold protein [Candidatus Micrarchaeota archaeon]
MPITSVDRESYEGLVYNLTVNESHSYVTPSVAVHNCGDLMRIFIKVKDDKIEDVKFTTFGCAAAIATSSMITDLAKGKTLEEALKIMRGDVSSELGGLPKIKEHCSNLAADGLHEAIYDYYSKIGKSIPMELESEHQRIQKTAAHEHEENADQ